MSSELRATQLHAADRVKSVFLLPDADARASQPELLPYLCFEVRIDFNDVRTGFRENVSLSKALEIYSTGADLLWTDDMIRDVNLTQTVSSAPEGVRLGVLPEFVDSRYLSQMEIQFARYLLRSFETKVFRNFDLNLYSYSGESRADFRRRCKDLLEGPKRQDLDSLHEVFVRRLEQSRQKYLVPAHAEALDQVKSESQKKDALSRWSDRIGAIFYHGAPDFEMAAEVPGAGVPDLDDRLVALEVEARQAVRKLCDGYEEKVDAVDEYILHPNLKDIHFVRSCILWMPGV